MNRKFSLITGACGFVGRNLTKRLLETTEEYLILVDDMSTGTLPELWGLVASSEDTYEKGRVLLIKKDIRLVLPDLTRGSMLIKKYFNDFEYFSDAFHFAAIVGGRSVIDRHPLKVAIDLAIDSEFFFWLTEHKPDRVLYPSSSAAYPVSMQRAEGFTLLKESLIDFDQMSKPDMSYGWTKLTGEYLAQLTANHYGISIACIRPFSGYGPDQSLDYPIPAIVNRFINKENPLEVWGTGEQVRDFVYIEDLIDGILLAIEHISDGTAVNLASGIATSFIDIIEMMSKISGHTPEVKKLVDKPVGVMHRVGDPNLTKELLAWQTKVSVAEGLEKVYLKRLAE